MLGHLRIIELGQVIAGTYGGMILADLGAQVIKVEPPAGDAGRRSAVYGIGDQSAIHLTLNRNKKSVVLDLKTAAGRAVLLDLVRGADAVVENFRPGVLDRLGVGAAELRRVNPEVVLVSVSGFGVESPYRDLPAYDLIMQAMTGHMAIMGEPGRPPVIMGIPIADLIAGVFSTVAVLAGVEGRRRSGAAEHFDLAMFDVMVELLAHVGTLYLNTGREQEPQGSAHPFITPWQAFRCADDRYIVVAPREEHFWPRLCRALDLPGLLQRPEFADAESRHAHRDALLPLLAERIAERPSGAWLDVLRAAGVPTGPVNRFPAVFGDPHVATRRMVRRFELDGAEFSTIGNAFKRRGAEEPPIAAPPRLGQDTDQVVASLPGYGAERVTALRAEGAFGPSPPVVAGSTSA